MCARLRDMCGMIEAGDPPVHQAVAPLAVLNIIFRGTLGGVAVDVGDDLAHVL